MGNWRLLLTARIENCVRDTILRNYWEMVNSMSERNLLFIVEGEADEPTFIRRLFRVCYAQQSYRTYTYKTNLHTLRRLTRAHAVLPGGNALILRQRPWEYTKYSLRPFPCLRAFLLRQNCFASDSLGFSRDFCSFGRRRAVARQGQKGKKHRKDWLSDVCALVNRRFSWFFIYSAIRVSFFPTVST